MLAINAHQESVVNLLGYRRSSVTQGFGHNSGIPYTPYSFRVRIRVGIRVRVRVSVRIRISVRVRIRVTD